MGQQRLEGDAVGVLTKATWVWAAFVVGFVVAGAAVLSLASAEKFGADLVFALAALWTLGVLPVMLVMKCHVLRSAWEARPADPATYFRSLLRVWSVIAVGAGLSLIACLTADAMLPGGLLAAGLLTLLVSLRPSAAALGGGMSADPA